MSGKLAIGDGVLWTSPCKRGEAERSLETAKVERMSLGDGSVVAIPTKSTSIASIEEIAYKIGDKCIFRL